MSRKESRKRRLWRWSQRPRSQCSLLQILKVTRLLEPWKSSIHSKKAALGQPQAQEYWRIEYHLRRIANTQRCECTLKLARNLSQGKSTVKSERWVTSWGTRGPALLMPLLRLSMLQEITNRQTRLYHTARISSHWSQSLPNQSSVLSNEHHRSGTAQTLRIG